MYRENDHLRLIEKVSNEGFPREVTVDRETSGGLLMVSTEKETFTVGKGEVEEVLAREVTFSVYPDPEGPYAVMDEEDPEMPQGILGVIQKKVDLYGGKLEDLPAEPAGTVRYSPGKEDGEVLAVSLGA